MKARKHFLAIGTDTTVNAIGGVVGYLLILVDETGTGCRLPTTPEAFIAVQERLKEGIKLVDVLVDAAPERAECPLTVREREVAGLIVFGYTNKEMATRLFISIKTIEKHRQSVYKALEVDGAIGLIRKMLRNNWVTLEEFMAQTTGENIKRVGIDYGKLPTQAGMKAVVEGMKKVA